MHIQLSQWRWTAMSHQPFHSQIQRVLVLCCICALLSYLIIWRAEYHVLTNGQGHLVHLQHDIEALNATIEMLKAKQKQWQQLQHQTDEKTHLIAGSQDSGVLIEWLEKETRKHGVDIKRMTWPTPVHTEKTTNDFLKMEQFELSLTGNFYAILDVFDEATQHSPRLIFNHMSWTRISEESAQLNVLAEGKMYRLNERQERE